MRNRGTRRNRIRRYIAADRQPEEVHPGHPAVPVRTLTWCNPRVRRTFFSGCRTPTRSQLANRRVEQFSLSPSSHMLRVFTTLPMRPGAVLFASQRSPPHSLITHFGTAGPARASWKQGYLCRTFSSGSIPDAADFTHLQAQSDARVDEIEFAVMGMSVQHGTICPLEVSGPRA